MSIIFLQVTAFSVNILNIFFKPKDDNSKTLGDITVQVSQGLNGMKSDMINLAIFLVIVALFVFM